MIQILFIRGAREQQQSIRWFFVVALQERRGFDSSTGTEMTDLETKEPV
jgi:hypothetical protein